MDAAFDARQIKAAFFDVDGTLMSFTTHDVPASARRALHALHEAGIKCILATGRPPYQCGFVPAEDFEAFITFNGQLCYTRAATLFDNPLDKDDVAVAVDQVRRGLYQCTFFEKDRCYISGYDGHTAAIEKISGSKIPVEDVRRALDHDIYQLNAYLVPGSSHILTDATANMKCTRWSEHFVDVMPRHGGKAAAVRRMLGVYGLAPEEAIAFGDGGNDLGMFGAVGTTVAMGNANPEVKEEADYVTSDVDDDGIWEACVRLGLIEG